MTGRWRLLGWTAGLAFGLRTLHAVGGGTLGVPLTSIEDLSAWLNTTPPDLMAMAFVRLLALAAGWYLAACTLALAVTRPFGRGRVASGLARATPAVVRRLVLSGGGLGLAAGALVGAAPPMGLAPATLAPKPAAASIADTTQDSGPPTATMTRLPEDDPPAAVMTRVPATDAPASRAPPAPAIPDPARTAVPSSWTVEAGDSFWSIAAETVAETAAPSGDPPNDGRIIGYWRRLLDANRGRLLDPGNPDLLVPGQEIVLPDPNG
jgi:LysM domain